MPGDPDKALQAGDQENIPLRGTRPCRPRAPGILFARAKVGGGRCRVLLFSVNAQQIRKMAGVLHNAIELLGVESPGEVQHCHGYQEQWGPRVGFYHRQVSYGKVKTL